MLKFVDVISSPPTFDKVEELNSVGLNFLQIRDMLCNFIKVFEHRHLRVRICGYKTVLLDKHHFLRGSTSFYFLWKGCLD